MQLNVLNDLAKAKRRWTEKRPALEPFLWLKTQAYDVGEKLKVEVVENEAVARGKKLAEDVETIFAQSVHRKLKVEIFRP